MSAPNDPAPPGDHPSPDQLADLVAGVLAEEASETAAHCDSCAQCGQLRDQLTALPGLLASVPAPPMPDPVAHRLQAALQQEAQRRTERQEGQATTAVVVPLRSRQRRWFAGLAAAAAAVVAVSVTTDALNAGSGEDASSAGDAGGSAEGGMTADEQTDDLREWARTRGGLVAGPVPRLTARLFSREAPVLAQKDGVPRAPAPPPGCTVAALRSAGAVGRLGPTVRLDGRLARLAVDEQAGVIRAYACAGGTTLATAPISPR